MKTLFWAKLLVWDGAIQSLDIVSNDLTDVECTLSSEDHVRRHFDDYSADSLKKVLGIPCSNVVPTVQELNTVDSLLKVFGKDLGLHHDLDLVHNEDPKYESYECFIEATLEEKIDSWGGVYNEKLTVMFARWQELSEDFFLKRLQDSREIHCRRLNDSVESAGRKLYGKRIDELETEEEIVEAADKLLDKLRAISSKK